jgi:hypothetical protein
MEDIMDGNRRCTDVLFLLLYFVFMVGLLAAGIYAFANGNPRQGSAPPLDAHCVPVYMHTLSASFLPVHTRCIHLPCLATLALTGCS